MIVWKYTEDVDSFEWLCLADDAHTILMIEHFKGMPFPKPWKPLPVYYPSSEELAALDDPSVLTKGDKRRGDFPSVGATVPVFTERALSLLMPLIESSVEVLPLTCERDRLCIVNVTEVVDCLDKERSKLVRLSSGGVLYVEHHAFVEEALSNKHMFKIPELPVAVYVSDTFKSAVEDNGLEGLLWKPLP